MIFSSTPVRGATQERTDKNNDQGAWPENHDVHQMMCIQKTHLQTLNHQCAVESFLARVVQRHRYAGFCKAHGDARTHGTRPNYGCRIDRARLGACFFAYWERRVITTGCMHA